MRVTLSVFIVVPIVIILFPDILLVKLMFMLLQLLCMIHVLRLLVISVSLVHGHIRLRNHIDGLLLLAATCLMYHRRHVLIRRLTRLKNCLTKGWIRCLILQMGRQASVSALVRACGNVIGDISRVLMLGQLEGTHNLIAITSHSQ